MFYQFLLDCWHKYIFSKIEIIKHMKLVYENNY